MSIPESALNYGSILTLLGENAEVNGKLNNKSITFTHIAIGDGNDQYVQPSRTQTTLVNEITRIPVTGMEKIEPAEEGGIPQLKVWAKIPDNIVDVAVREFAAIAVYDGNSYLHAVGNSVRIPILSGVNNGGEVNDIYIEMTFAVTSLDPIIMIDPTIVTATRKYVDDKDKAHVDAPDPHTQYLTRADFLKHMLFKGMPMSAVGPDPDPDFWLPAGRVELLRADYQTVFEIVSASDFFTDQATIDADPRAYAGHWGTGDGATTFTTDDWALMMNIKVAGGYGAAGSTKKDHIENITGKLTSTSGNEGMVFNSPGQVAAVGALALEDTVTSTIGGNLNNTASNTLSFDASKSARTDTFTDTMGLFLDHYRVIPKGVFSYA
ncbi:phage tail protein [Vibrio plantisponsor]|uniref:Phage tail protein n=1 Tax=Vibrio plantisponsor TaxID=664643 RepID=A0ABU4IGF6_9VIBR|nr:phage tail protein [Vibrio plantisponsor]MDW6017638.1 phage tail protein [Vibrio plantisponsor]